MWKLYRLMVFNFLIGNKEDHAKNFIFLFNDNECHLSPAFDILLGGCVYEFHTTYINNSIKPKKEDLFIWADRVVLDRI